MSIRKLNEGFNKLFEQSDEGWIFSDQLLKKLNDLVYQVNTCVKGVKTNCHTTDQLADYMEKLAEQVRSQDKIFSEGCHGKKKIRKKKIQEKANPENEPVNSKVRKVLYGDADDSDIDELKKQGYDVEIEDTEFDTIGTNVRIHNPRTGKGIYGNRKKLPNGEWEQRKINTYYPDLDRKGTYHHIKDFSSRDRQTKFDYKNYLNSKRPMRTSYSRKTGK